MPGLAESIALRLRSWLGGEVNRAAAAAAPLPRASNASAAVAELDAVAGATSVAASAGGVARAVARAAAGERTTLRLADQDLSQAFGALREAGRRHVGLVAVWSDTNGADDGGATVPALAFAGHGIAVLGASTVQEAYDAAALARWLAEATLAPVLVVLRGTAAAATGQAWQALDPLVLANWLGRPTDEVDAATPAQAWLFGRQRARLAARWDGGHPVAVGQGFAAADRRAASDSSSEWFDNAWLALAASGSASLRALTGRDALPLVQAVTANPSRRARPMAGHSSFPQRELLIEAVRRDYPDAVARNGKAAVQVAAPADPWLQRALRHRSDREGGAADCGSLARLWGEHVLPRAAGEGVGELDPWLAASTTPAASAELFDRSAGRAQLPAFEAANCTACGACWSACPDAALAPVALGSHAWLDAAADRAMAQGARGPGADRSKRLHKTVAQRLDDELACTGAATVTTDAARAAWEGAADKANLQGDERAAAQASWNRTLAEALRLPPAVARGLFHDAHARSRGSGLLLQLAVDPRVCQDCGLCVAVCQDGALTAQPQVEIALATARAAWLCWDQTPDTTGAVIDAAKGAGLDNLAALLLSRHANRALCGADFAAAASGQRLAVRVFAAVAEARRSVAQLRRVRDLEALAAQLDEATRSVFAAAAPTGDPQAMLAALDATAGRTAPLGALSLLLAEQGLGTSLDVARLRRLAEAAGLVAEMRHRLTRAAGWGQARYGVVVAGPTIAAWAGRFPRNPFTGPVWIDPTPGGFDAAVGFAQAELAQAVAAARAARAAQIALANAADADLQLRELVSLRVQDLTETERAAAMPVLVLADRAAVQDAGLAGLGRALASGLALHVLYLRDGDGNEPVDLVRFARAAGDIAAASTSFAHRDHLYACAAAAIDSHQPSLTAVLALEPARDSWPSAELLTRSAAAVDDGRQTLVRLAAGQSAEADLAAAVQAARDEAAIAHKAELDQALAEAAATFAAELVRERERWQADALQRLRDQLARLARSAPASRGNPGNGAAA